MSMNKTSSHISPPPGRGQGGRARTITLIIIHCSAVTPEQTSSARQIDQWHRAQGWKCIGYHYVVRRDGTIEMGRPESEIGAHCQNHNTHSIGVCYEGGLDSDKKPSDTRTTAQKQSLLLLIQELKSRYPKAIVVGHHDMNPQKACPCFNAAREFNDL